MSLGLHFDAPQIADVTFYESRNETIRASQSSLYSNYASSSSSHSLHSRRNPSISSTTLSSLNVEALLDSCDLDELDWPAQALAEEDSEDDLSENDPERTPRPSSQKFNPKQTSPTPARTHNFLLKPESRSPISAKVSAPYPSASPPLASSSSFPLPPARSDVTKELQVSRDLISALQLSSPQPQTTPPSTDDATTLSSHRLSSPPSLPPKAAPVAELMQRGYSDSQVAGNRMLNALHSSVANLRSDPLFTPPFSDVDSGYGSPLRSSVQSSMSHSSSGSSFRWSSGTDSTTFTVPSVSTRSSPATSRKGSIGADSIVSMSRSGSHCSSYGYPSPPAIAESPLDEEAATDYMLCSKPIWSEYIDQQFANSPAQEVKPLALPSRSPPTPPRKASMHHLRSANRSPTNKSLSPPGTIRKRTASNNSTIASTYAPSVPAAQTLSPAPAPALKQKKSFANFLGLKKQSSVASLRTVHGNDQPISPPRKSRSVALILLISYRGLIC